jgi:methionyl-tRNA formyltransferase|tara:strand:+ start:2138 stop:3055 length:918 start_codon:yes stop_codon:yes gene_type:complete
MSSKIRVGVIGCTLSTKNIISFLCKKNNVDLIGLITLDSSVSDQKARYTRIDNNDFSTHFDIVPVLNLHDYSLEEKLLSWNLDILVEIGWSHKIPKSILMAPKFGTVGIHNSLLPAYQGGASLNWALIKDSSSWGCTLFYLEENIDAGEIIFQESFDITDEDDINSLFLKSDKATLNMIDSFLPLIKDNLGPRIKQDPKKVTKTPKRTPKDSAIEWSSDNRSIFNLVRAMKRPYPCAFSFLNDKKVFINNAATIDGSEAEAGIITDILSSGFIVSTGSGSILLSEVEYEDGRLFIPKIGDRFNEQ